MLARQAVTLDHATSGRFELGIGWGSVPTEFETFAVGDSAPRARVDRLTETLEVLLALWSGEQVSYSGKYHTLTEAQQVPAPLRRIPIVIGGSGPRTLALVARFADWWNCPIHRLDRYSEMRERIGDAKSSIQERVTFIPKGADRTAILQTARRRFGNVGHATGNAEELIEHYAARVASGIERTYVWMSDFAVPIL